MEKVKTPKPTEPNNLENNKTPKTFVLSPEVHERIETRIKNLDRAARSVLAGLVFSVAGPALAQDQALDAEKLNSKTEQTLKIDGKNVTGSFISSKESNYIFSAKDGTGYRYDKEKNTFTKLKEFTENKSETTKPKTDKSKDLTPAQFAALNALSKANADAGVSVGENVKKINEQLSPLGKVLGGHKDATKVNSKTLDTSHGSMDQDTRNNIANKQAGLEAKGKLEQNVFNSDEDIKKLVAKEGKEKHFYTPSKVGKASPYWNGGNGEIINSQSEYDKHIENLRSDGYKGTQVNPDNFGFKLEKNQFITTLKYDTIVKAQVIGGEGYVLLKQGTKVIFERNAGKDSSGRPCNVLRYIESCHNLIYADDPRTNKDGSGGFVI